MPFSLDPGLPGVCSMGLVYLQKAEKNNGRGPIVLNESSIELFLGLVNGMPTLMNIQVTIREGRKERGQV